MKRYYLITLELFYKNRNTIKVTTSIEVNDTFFNLKDLDVYAQKIMEEKCKDHVIGYEFESAIILFLHELTKEEYKILK